MFLINTKKENETIDTAKIPFYSEKYNEIVEKRKLERQKVYLQIKNFIKRFRVIVIIIFYLVLFLLIYWYFVNYYDGKL